VTRVGLVLGAGGVVGQAYHAGVLAVLAHDFGWDPRTADVIVGTSAGSITGTLLRLGVSPEDLAAWTVKAPLSDEEDELLQRMAGASIPELEPFRPGHLWFRRPVRPPTVHMLRRAVIRPWQFRPMAAGLALLAPGRNDIVAQLGALRDLEKTAWPSRDLWICAVRRMDGRRIVFGRPGAPEAPIHLAVAASCAIPGYFAPVLIGEHTYVDGGGHSPTNAALLRSRDLDLVIVVSPMSGPPGARPDLYAALRRHSARVLQREVRALQNAGIKTVVFSPGDEEQRVMGNDMMSALRLDEVLRESYLAAGVQAAGPEVSALLHQAADRRAG
jgi:NTE family protein